MATFLRSSKVIGCVTVSHPHRHPLRCPLSSAPHTSSIPLHAALHSGLSAPSCSSMATMKTWKPSSRLCTSACGQAVHYIWIFFLCASLGATQRMGRRSSLTQIPRALPGGWSQECSTWDTQATILSAFSPPCWVSSFPRIWNLFCFRN